MQVAQDLNPELERQIEIHFHVDGKQMNKKKPKNLGVG